ncbi:MAG: TolC family protein [Bacteroidales bacterium]|nr:TolC family protein [Bacteroidales bacterium]
MKRIKLKHHRHWLALAIIFFGSQVLYAQAPETLTLDFCHKRAVEVYPLVKQKSLNDESSALRLENLDKNYLPQFELNGRASYQSEVTKVPINIPGMDIPSPDKDVYDLYLGLNQLIWDGGITKDQKNIEEADLKISQQKIEVELYRVKELVNALFFKILLMNQNKELLLTNRKSVNDKLTEMESGIRHGIVLSSNADVLRAQILLIDQNVAEIDTDREAHFRMLGELLELVIPPSAILLMPDPPVNTDFYLNLRPEYELLSLQQNKIELSKNLVSSAYMPKVSGFGKLGYGKPGLNMLSDNFNTYYHVGLGLSWDIMNWNKQKNQKKLLDLQLGIAETGKETFDKNVKIQVEDDLAQISKYSGLITKDEEIIVLRERITKTSSSQLDNGIITSSQYLDELNRETQARMNLEMHRIQLSFAKVNYLKTIGKL